MLTGSIFMLEVYDRVLPSRRSRRWSACASSPLFLFVGMGVLDLIRARILVRIGASLDEALSGRVYETLVRLPLKAGSRSDGLQPLRDLDNVRSFLSGIRADRAVRPALDADLSRDLLRFPFLDRHGRACSARIILVALTLLTEFWTAQADAGLRRRPRSRATGSRRSAIRNAEALSPWAWSGASPRAGRRPTAATCRASASASDVAGGLGAISKVAAHDAAVGRARGRRLSRDQPAGDRRHHHRGLDPVGARARAGRSRDRQLEGLRGRAPELAAAEPAAALLPAQTDVDAAAAAGSEPCGRERRASRRPASRRSSCRTSASRCRPATGSASSGRARRASPRWRACWSASGSRRAATSGSTAPRSINGCRRRSAGTSATCRRTSSCSPARWRRTSRASSATPTRRRSSAAAKAAGVHDLIVNLPEGYETQIGEQGTRAVGRPAPAHRAGARALSRSVPGRAGRAQFQSRCRRRRGADAGDPRRARSAAASWSWSRTGRARWQAVDLLLVMSKGRVQHPVGPKDEVLAKVLQRRPQPRAAAAARSCLTPGEPRHEPAKRSAAQPLHPPPHRRRASSSSSLLVGGVGGWAGTTQLSGALIAPGSIVVDSNVKKVQHPTGGVVGEVRVRDGDRVKAGDIVVRLDETVTRANLAIVTKGLNELVGAQGAARSRARRRRGDRIPANAARAASTIPTSRSIMDGERKLFDLRRTARAGQKAQLRQRIAQLEEEIAGLTAQRNAKAQGDRADRARARPACATCGTRT